MQADIARMSTDVGRMSDTVLLAIVVAINGILTAIIGIVMMVVKARLDRTALATATTQAAVEGTKAMLHGQVTVIADLEKNTNSMKDQLVALTAKEQRAVGRLEGQESERGKQAALRASESGEAMAFKRGVEMGLPMTPPNIEET